jgi:hypothetical protein
VCVVHRNPVEDFSGGEDSVPRGFEARDASAPQVVHLRVAVVDLEQRRVADLTQLLGRDGPPEIRMVDVRDTTLVPDRIHITLQNVHH